eukprot:TRINITY_DN51123_c0_g1_i1.p1 TRINITY_DN51123_c0_g1~~TRINITY_DN51123_c0_g1_i1.p1  ORF type:complete len:270 (+),score=31.99 TRINITY_DN51123_c0_g1_i1:69-812(+)
MRAACETVAQEIVEHDQNKTGNRGSGRYSFGFSSTTRQMLHNPSWVKLLVKCCTSKLIDAVKQVYGGEPFSVWGSGGDFVLGRAYEYQQLHSDLGVKDVQYSHQDQGPPLLVINFAVQDLTQFNGPTRIIPGTQFDQSELPKLQNETWEQKLSTVCPIAQGAAIIRDARTWHAGTPNITTNARYLPNVEFMPAWWRETVSVGGPACLPKSLFDKHIPPEVQTLCEHLVQEEGGPTGAIKANTGKPHR